MTQNRDYAGRSEMIVAVILPCYKSKDQVLRVIERFKDDVHINPVYRIATSIFVLLIAAYLLAYLGRS